MPDLPASGSVFSAEISALPSGYSGLPRQLVEASQRQRLIHGVVIAVAASGFASVTVSEIATRAGVSKKTFYAYFPNKLSCFLAAYEHGCAAMLEAIVAEAGAAAKDELSAVDQLRGAIKGFMRFLVTEEPFARAFYFEIPAAGPDAIAARRTWRESFVAIARIWHETARQDHPDWPIASDLALEAVAAIANDIAYSYIASGQASELTTMVEPLAQLQLDILRVPYDEPTREPMNGAKRVAHPER